MDNLRSPYPESEDDSEDQYRDNDDEGDESEDWDQPSAPMNPDHKAIGDFVDMVVPSGQLDWATAADAIFSRYPALERTSELTGKTVLHLLIEEWVKNANSGRGFSHFKRAFTAIFNRYPHLVKVRDGVQGDLNGQTVLYSAMAGGSGNGAGNGGSGIISVLFPESKDKKTKRKADPVDPVSQALSQALAVMCSFRGREENALHLAMRSKSDIVPTKILRRIVRIAPESAVAAVDNHGFTPLHYAVDYARCGVKGQSTLVTTLLNTGESARLIKKGKAVLDFRTHEENLSVYQYHVKTREQYREKIPGLKAGQLQSNKGDEDITTIKAQRELKRLQDRQEEIKRHQERERRDRDRDRDRAEPNEDDEVEKDKAGRPPRSSTRKAASAPNHAHDDARNQSSIKGPPIPQNDDSRNQNPGKGPPGGPRDDPRSQVAGKEGPGKEGPKDGRRGRDSRPDMRAPPDSRDESMQPSRSHDIRESDIRSPITPGAMQSLAREPKEAKKERKELTPEERKVERDACSDEIKLELKLQYMRTRNHHQSVEFLYGKNSTDIQISFEYSGLALEADTLSFEESFSDVIFDEVLKYVAFPAVRIKDWRNKPEKCAVLEKARGRFDMLFFFHWLREVKKVKRILKVIVEDCISEQPPHSDEAIEECLKGFDVETLDWSKPDFNPETACVASSKLSEVVLHWTGNSAVLRAWSDPEIRQRLPRLTNIHLIVDSTLETTDRTKESIDAFENRLQTKYAAFVPAKAALERATAIPPSEEASVEKKAAKDRAMMPPPPVPNTGIRRTTTEVFVNINSQPDSVGGSQPTATAAAAVPADIVEPPEAKLRPVTVFKAGLESLSLRRSDSGTVMSTSDAVSMSSSSHRWLDATDAFAEQIDNVWRKIVQERTRAVKTAINSVVATRGSISDADRADIEAKQGPPRDIIVAIIDDGVDTTVEHLSRRVLPGRTFSYDEERDRVRPWYVSENNHGTIMASMVVRVCPMAKIYPIRLSTGATVGTINPKCAPQAIEAALDRGVDIISMSWTVSPPTAPNEKQAFDAALQRAIANNVLMFCSAIDKGHFSDQYYPAGYRPDSMIKVGAANPAGLIYEWVGPIDRVDFLFPGVEVVAQHGNGGPAGLSKLPAETGSSVATALGAGLAAMLLYCARIADMTGTVGLTAADVERIKNRDVMTEVIKSFGQAPGEKGGVGKFIEIWKKLKGRTETISKRGAGSKESRNAIAQLARDLINISA